MMKACVGLMVLATGCALAPASSAGTVLTPSPYRSFADSPFTGPFDWFRLQNFESGATSVPGATISAGPVVLAPGPLTDSVDADDGAIDGSGSGGRSLYSNGVQRITITFDPTVLGRLPTHVGVVVTDVGISTASFGVGRFAISASIPSTSAGEVVVAFPIGSSFITTSSGTSVTIPPLTLALGAPSLANFIVRDPLTGGLIDSRTGLPVTLADFSTTIGDARVDGATDEDRFFGLIEPFGISSFTIESFDSTDWEIDHLQFGFSAAVAATVPAPAPLTLFAAGSLALGFARRIGRSRSACLNRRSC